jgi:predicted O-methyltransferase YrrM
LRSVRHSELSILTSADDDSRPNEFLLRLSFRAIQDALETDLGDLPLRNKDLPDSVYYNVFPGEHYRLLQVLARDFAKRNIIEVGTFTGMSAACMLRGMTEGCKFTSYDLVSWRDHRSHLDEEDFAKGRIKQFLEDLSDPTVFAKHRSLFENAELIFCDAPKDGVFEPRFFANLTTAKPTSPCLLVLDDTRLLNMIDVWRAIRSPKLDLSSFGHWSGTGLIDMTNGLQFEM